MRVQPKNRKHFRPKDTIRFVTSRNAANDFIKEFHSFEAGQTKSNAWLRHMNTVSRSLWEGTDEFRNTLGCRCTIEENRIWRLRVLTRLFVDAGAPGRSQRDGSGLCGGPGIYKHNKYTKQKMDRAELAGVNSISFGNYLQQRTSVKFGAKTKISRDGDSTKKTST